MKYYFIAIFALLICSAFIYDKGPQIDVDHDAQYGNCTSCHHSFSPDGEFESYKADMRVHYETWSIVVVNEIRGEMCNVSGIEVKGWHPCADFGTPQNYDFETGRG